MEAAAGQAAERARAVEEEAALAQRKAEESQRAARRQRSAWERVLGRDVRLMDNATNCIRYFTLI